MKNSQSLVFRTIIAVALCLPFTASFASDSGWDAGFRYTILVGQGEPSNDMAAIGLFGHVNWRDDWYFGFGVDQFEFDYENPARSLGLPTDTVIDGANEMTQISGWLERRYGEESGKWSWFWTAGLGYGFVTADTVAGETTDGEPYFITTDASDEFQLLASIGFRYDFSANWRFETAALVQHHFTDYKLTDEVSGATASMGAQTPVGIYFGISYRF